MSDLEIVIAALFVSAAGLNALANWLKVPYPIPLVIGGLVLGLVPGIPDIELDPDWCCWSSCRRCSTRRRSSRDLRALRHGRAGDLAEAIGLVLVRRGRWPSSATS